MSAAPRVAARPDCWRCRHHEITHQAGFPYACRAMGFKSRRLPMREVIAASGAPCLCFAPTSRAAPAPGEGAERP